MKATELMIGDWIVKPSGHIRTIDRAEFSNDDAWFEDIKPIPLTPEILEKNGFERSLIVPSKFYRNVDNEQLSLCPFSTCYELAYIHWGESDDADIAHRLVMQQPIIYVHTLQHDLRLFGLNQLADNFKV